VVLDFDRDLAGIFGSFGLGVDEGRVVTILRAIVVAFATVAVLVAVARVLVATRILAFLRRHDYAVINAMN
jgi:hypothetical protein